MEIKALEYFLTIAREGSITDAAHALHVTQPTLSRQLAALEDELGVALYTRSQRGVELTEQGVLLQSHAENIVGLARKAEEDLRLTSDSVQGTVHIAVGDTPLIALIARAMRRVRARYPKVTFALASGRSADLKERLVKGRYDVMLECELQHHAKLNVLPFPAPDRWGVVMRKDDPLAALPRIAPADLVGRQIIGSLQGSHHGALPAWFEGILDEVEVIGEYSLPLSSRAFVQEGFGIALMYEGLFVDEEGDASLCFRPLFPEVTAHQGLIWRKTLPTKQTQAFIDELRQVVAEERARLAGEQGKQEETR